MPRILVLLISVGLLGCDNTPKQPRAMRPKAEGAAKNVQPKEAGPVLDAPTVTTSDIAPEVRLTLRPPLMDTPLAEFRQPTEQEAAAAALGRIGKSAVPSLIQALRHRDAEVRRKAALVLARIGPDAAEAVPKLTAALDDENEDVRKAATRALGQIGPAASEAVPALMRRLMETRPEVPRR